MTDPYFPPSADRREEDRPSDSAPQPDPNLRQPRDEQHPQAPQVRDSMEGVRTGPDNDHYVHLANGAIVEGHNGGTHYDDAERGLIPIVAVYPKG